MRQGVNPLENKADSSKLFLGFALRSEMKKDFDAEFGKTIYSFSERDRIKLASFPLNDHNLRISMEKEEQHATLIENILKMISNCFFFLTNILFVKSSCACLSSIKDKLIVKEMVQVSRLSLKNYIWSCNLHQSYR